MLNHSWRFTSAFHLFFCWAAWTSEFHRLPRRLLWPQDRYPAARCPGSRAPAPRFCNNEISFWFFYDSFLEVRDSHSSVFSWKRIIWNSNQIILVFFHTVNSKQVFTKNHEIHYLFCLICDFLQNPGSHQQKNKASHPNIFKSIGFPEKQLPWFTMVSVAKSIGFSMKTIDVPSNFLCCFHQTIDLSSKSMSCLLVKQNHWFFNVFHRNQWFDHQSRWFFMVYLRFRWFLFKNINAIDKEISKTNIKQRGFGV